MRPVGACREFCSLTARFLDRVLSGWLPTIALTLLWSYLSLDDSFHHLGVRL